MPPRVNAFLKLGREQGCSDIHLSVGMPPMLRLYGELSPIKYRELTPEELDSLVDEILTEKQRQYFLSGEDLDFSYQHEEVGRYRVNLFRKVSGLGASFRVIAPKIPSLEQLNLPTKINEFLYNTQGLILVTGATGTGKSTTLAAMINWLNHNKRLNIITLEDPIEYVHVSEHSLLVQREVGTHVNSFSEGLRSALREDPDVILVGELRDNETISMAMTAAETGHLVLGTLHTTSAVKTLDRIIDAVPIEQKEMVKTFLAQHLQGVISQKLVRTLDRRGQKAIIEIMVNNSALAHLILNNKIHQIPSILQTGREDGMQLMDQSLLESVKNKEIDPDDAYLHANDKKQFQRFVTDPDLLPQINLAIN